MSEGYAYSMGGENLKNDFIMEILTDFDKSKVSTILDGLQKFILIDKPKRKQLKAGDIYVSIRKYYSDKLGPHWTYDHIFFDKDCQVLFWEKN